MSSLSANGPEVAVGASERALSRGEELERDAPPREGLEPRSQGLRRPRDVGQVEDHGGAEVPRAGWGGRGGEELLRRHGYSAPRALLLATDADRG